MNKTIFSIRMPKTIWQEMETNMQKYTEKWIFPKIGTVMSSAEFLQSVG